VQFTEAIKIHTDAAQRGIALLRESSADDAVIAEIAFTSALAVQSEVLQEHIKNDTPQSEDENPILAVAEVIAEARSSAESIQSDNTAVSYEALFAAVELESTRVYELFDSIKKDASSDVVVDIERRLADVERKMNQAVALEAGTPLTEEVSDVARIMVRSNEPDSNAKMLATEAMTTSEASSTDEILSTAAMMSAAPIESADFVATATSPVADVSAELPRDTKAEATELLRNTLSDIQKLINYLSNIEVRETVSVDALVPVTLTAEEKSFEIKALYDESVKIMDFVATQNVSTKYRNKVRYGTNQVEEKLKNVATFLAVGDLEKARALVEEALTMARDVEKMVAISSSPETVTEGVVEKSVETASTTAQ
jgi:hypothetical protein